MSKKIAYILKDIDLGSAIVKEGSIFQVDKKDPKILHGFWHGYTSELKTVSMEFDWEWKDKVSYYEVPKKCIPCKYCHFEHDGWDCGEYICIQ